MARLHDLPHSRQRRHDEGFAPVPRKRSTFRLRLVAAASLLVTVVSAAVLPAAPAAAAPASDASPVAAAAYQGYFRLRNLNAGYKCMGVEGGEVNTLSRVLLWDCLDGSAGGDQTWLIDTASASLAVKNYENPYYCLGIMGGSRSQGAQVVVAPCDNTANQRWHMEGSSECGGYILVNNSSEMLASVEGRSTANGAPIIQWRHGGTRDQTWCLMV